MDETKKDMDKKETSNARATQSRTVHRSFKSPQMCRKPEDKQSNKASLYSVPSREELIAIQKEIDESTENLKRIENTIQEMEEQGLDESELAEHIAALHEYNDIRDAAQKALGIMANKLGVPTRNLYKKFGLDLDD